MIHELGPKDVGYVEDDLGLVIPASRRSDVTLDASDLGEGTWQRAISDMADVLVKCNIPSGVPSWRTP